MGPKRLYENDGNILKELNYKGAMVFLNDIIIYTRTFEEHLEILETIFLIFEQVNLKLKPTKCKFLQKQIEFLGHSLSEDGIATNAKKYILVQECLAPKTPKQLKFFLGLAN